MNSHHPIQRSPISARGRSVVERAGWQIAEAYSTAEAEAAAVRTSAGLADLSALGKVLIQGAALPALQAAFGGVPGQTGEVAAVEGGLLACLAPDEWYLTAPVGGEAQALERLQGAISAAGAFAHATDVTHAYAALLLAGPRSREVLPKLCGLDFHPAAFPNWAVRQSSVARLRAIIIRDDLAGGGLPAYQLHVGRSEADYLWGVLLDAAAEFDALPVGAAALSLIQADANTN
jgi:heterotetrameric sarcosine oxidase gamma subunit